MPSSPTGSLFSPDLDLPALVPHGVGAVLADPKGACKKLSLQAAGRMIKKDRLFLCHWLFTARRLGARLPTKTPNLFDVMELYAFVFPAQPAVPNPAGLAEALSLSRPVSPEEQARFLREAVAHLLQTLARPDFPLRSQAAIRAAKMGALGWNWGEFAALAAGGEAQPPALSPGDEEGADSFALLERWHESSLPAPAPPPVLHAQEVETMLEGLLARRGLHPRASQKRYALGAAKTFGLAENGADEVQEGVKGEVVLIQAGTGTGKTMAYAAPALLAARRKGWPVWIATYTRNLQSQLEAEFAAIATSAPKTDPALLKHPLARPVIRKGRENYLCLLNFANHALSPRNEGEALLAHFIARWIPKTRDGDLRSGDFPLWLAQLTGGEIGAFTDRRGECIHAACPHYRRCFVEKARWRAQTAPLVIANHALVLTHASLRQRGQPEEAREDANSVPYYIFDEAHHIFDSADSAFSSRLTGAGMAELAAWLFGQRQTGAAALRGLARRLLGLLDEEGETLLGNMLEAAVFLPRAGWAERVEKNRPHGAGESFLAALRDFVEAQSTERDMLYDASARFDSTSETMRQPVHVLSEMVADFLHAGRKLLTYLAEKSENSEGAVRALTHRLEETASWLAILHLAEAEEEVFYDDISDDAPPASGQQILLARLERGGGKTQNPGLHCHYLDPTEIFADKILQQAPGALLTSASLQEESAESYENWQSVEWRTGGHHLTPPPSRLRIPSPFDYAASSLVLVVNDVPLDDSARRHEAMRDFFLIAKGGGLGLFTSIRRLRAAAKSLVPQLAEAGLLLLAQHEDPLPASALVDFFRAEKSACLLGTDALRDGIDVPGEGLQLVVFDRLPFPRPDPLHLARRQYFGGYGYDDRIVRLRLHQAFGRLIRRESDKGLFVLFDARFGSRFAGAFPETTQVKKLPLQEALLEAEHFFSQNDAQS